MIAQHVSGLIGPSSGAFFYLQAVFADLVCGNTRTTQHVSRSTRISTYHSLQIQLVRNDPDDGPMMSETCRANISAG